MNAIGRWVLSHTTHVFPVSVSSGRRATPAAAPRPDGVIEYLTV